LADFRGALGDGDGFAVISVIDNGAERPTSELQSEFTTPNERPRFRSPQPYPDRRQTRRAFAGRNRRPPLSL